MRSCIIACIDAEMEDWKHGLNCLSGINNPLFHYFITPLLLSEKENPDKTNFEMTWPHFNRFGFLLIKSAQPVTLPDTAVGVLPL